VSGRYVALGSSMAAGPGIRPKAPGAPSGSGRSAVNYAHLVAARFGYDLVDVTFSGATTANVLVERQRSAAPQVDALDGSEELVTITIGGNDVGYVPMLFAAGLPRWVGSLPVLGGVVRGALDVDAREEELGRIGESLRAVGREVKRRAPRARVLFVDYLTLLPPAGTPAPPFSEERVAIGRRIADTLERVTEEAATDTGCELIRASAPSRGHHAWSDDPWTSKFGLPLPGRVTPLHPNATGMRAVADLIVGRLT
jgi:lysophospholipase L1-like esterase